jgi:hypothetical protein
MYPFVYKKVETKPYFKMSLHTFYPASGNRTFPTVLYNLRFSQQWLRRVHLLGHNAMQSLDSQQTTLHYIPADRLLHSHHVINIYVYFVLWDLTMSKQKQQGDKHKHSNLAWCTYQAGTFPLVSVTFPYECVNS